MSDRAFLVSFGMSMGLHLLLVVGQLLSLDWFHVPLRRTPMEVVYDRAVEQEALRVLQERLATATRDAIASPAPAALGAQTEIRIPDRPLLTAGQDLSEIMPDRASIVDLTNLVDAARGDPVLLSYFSAIREQIQRTANAQAWVTGELRLLRGAENVSHIGRLSPTTKAQLAVKHYPLRVISPSLIELSPRIRGTPGEIHPASRSAPRRTRALWG